MQHQEFQPPDELRDAIKCVWYTKMDFGVQPSSFDVVPDGYAELIFYFGSTCSISCEGNLQPLPSPFMMGLLNQPVLFYAENQLEIIGIRCFPWAVFNLLGLPPGKNSVYIVEHPIARLQPALAECISVGKVNEAVHQVKQYFLRTQAGILTDSMLAKAGVAMTKTNGTMPVSQVAAAAHTTVRTLERKFRKSSGHTVKDVSGLMRFEQVRNHLWLYPDASLAGLAHDLGYTDQSHLSRAFRRYSGTTPAAFARQARSGQSETVSNFVAFIQA